MNALTHDLVPETKRNEAEGKPSGTPYRRPELIALGSLEQVQAYYDGHYYDGPQSSYWYD